VSVECLVHLFGSSGKEASNMLGGFMAFIAFSHAKRGECASERYNRAICAIQPSENCVYFPPFIYYMTPVYHMAPQPPANPFQNTIGMFFVSHLEGNFTKINDSFQVQKYN
jgi:hypothetical protein